ncbi:MAG: hypothetical protein ACI90A_001102, partial [Shewanella sp.]
TIDIIRLALFLIVKANTAAFEVGVCVVDVGKFKGVASRHV